MPIVFVMVDNNISVFQLRPRIMDLEKDLYSFFGTKGVYCDTRFENSFNPSTAGIQLVMPRQTHGDTIGKVTAQNNLHPFPATDALITNQPNICVAVKTADCVPILLYDPVHRAVAAIHSGWRGTVFNITAKTVYELQKQYGSNPGDLLAVIGPCISQKHYEIGAEVAIQFETHEFSARNLLLYQKEKAGKAFLDLRSAVLNQLLAAGLCNKHIEISDECTFSKPDLFYSARRDGATTGRMINGIMLL
jgi:polyphenol oxidase